MAFKQKKKHSAVQVMAECFFVVKTVFLSKLPVRIQVSSVELIFILKVCPSST